MAFTLLIQPQAREDIQQAVFYYNKQQKGLGKRFFDTVFKNINLLKKSPFFQLRYDDIRCLPVEPFPYMIHFVVNENSSTVSIYAVVNTSQDPDTTYVKK